MTTTEVPPIKEILEERGNRYGKFQGHAALTQKLKLAMHNHPRWHLLTDSKKESLDMVAHKIGRIINGDPDYLDSWIDIIGYVQLEVDIINENF